MNEFRTHGDCSAIDDEGPPIFVPTAKRFRGSFVIRKATASYQRHASYAAAEAEAFRLLRANVNATFVIAQEVGCVKFAPRDDQDTAPTSPRRGGGAATNPPPGVAAPNISSRKAGRD